MPILDLERKREVTVVAGVSQSGKTTFAIRYMINHPDLVTRYCFDPEGEYSKRLGIPAARDGYELELALTQGWVLFDPHTLFPGRLEDAFAFFCDFAFERSSAMPGAKLLAVDEVWQYCTPQQIPAELKVVCQTGRKRGLGLMVNTQEPQKLNSAILGSASEFVAFHLQFERALELCAGWGFDPEELKALPDLHFVSRTSRGAQLRGRIEL